MLTSKLLSEKGYLYTSSLSVLEHIIANLFFLSILFPYITFGFPSVSDTQPWAVLFGTILIGLNCVKDNRKIAARISFLWLVIGFCIINLTFFFIFKGESSIIMYFRTIYKYVAFAVIVPSVVLSFSVLSSKILRASISIWWCVVILQFVLKRPIIDFLLPRASLTFGRNLALGFAPEPAYLAKMAIFFFLLIDLYELKREFSKPSAIVLRVFCVWMIIQSASLTGFFLLIIYMLSSIIILILKTRLTLQNIIGFFLIGVFIVLLIGILSKLWRYVLLIGRLGTFLSIIEEQDLISALISDPSFVSRFSRIASLPDMLRDKAFFGYGVPEYPIGSIFSVIYETGVYGLVLLVLLFYFFWKAIRKVQEKETKFFIVKTGVVFLALVFSESLASSYVPFIIGLIVFLSKGTGTRCFEQM